ncbi:MAG: aldehyde oxidase and xanthine dehydrogenase [Dehalococcoidia bacterium]|nr:aldehyde oxidase and xanthine dehydrogenase [Dehalococcoidia bacterium]
MRGGAAVAKPHTPLLVTEEKLSIVGQSPVRKGVEDLAAGKAKFTGDFSFPDLLVGLILRSHFPHARIRGIDTAQAEKLPGVRAVVTHRDTPHVRIGRWISDRPVLAWDKVCYAGDPVAAVAAVDRETAEAALALIRVDYDELPAVFDVEEAMRPGAPIIHEALSTYKTEGRIFGQGNTLLRTELRVGEVEGAWDQCDVLHEDTYRTQVVHHGFIEPHEALAAPDASGKITLWCTTKAAFTIRSGVARALGLPMSRLRVIAPAVGGDYGGKGTVQMEPICVLLAMKAAQPVKISLTRQEELTATYMRQASVCRLKVGARNDGRLVALQGEIIYDTGAYCDLMGLSPGRLDLFLGPYKIPNVQFTAHRVYTNNTPRGHMRGPGGPQPCFAVESHLDMVARKLGISPVEFRLRNSLDEGDVMSRGTVVIAPGIKETLRRTGRFLAGAQKGPNQGWGVASLIWDGVNIKQITPSSAAVKINEDGTVVLITGAPEQGGGPHTILSQIVAEVLGVPYEAVSVFGSDTDATPFETSVGGSRTTYRVGNTVRLAAESAREQLFELAAEKLGVGPEGMTAREGRIHAGGQPEKSVSIVELAGYALKSRGSLIQATGRVRRREWYRYLAGEAAAHGPHGEVLDGSPQGTQAVKVEVDPQTGRVRVLEYFACHDVGRALHRGNVEGQIDGAVVLGLGYALSEEVRLKDGRTLVSGFTDYKMPTAADALQVKTDIVEFPSHYGPFGAKGIAEPASLPVAPAIANAIYDAVGVRLRELPLTPEKVLRALRERGSMSGTTPSP